MPVADGPPNGKEKSIWLKFYVALTSDMLAAAVAPSSKNTTSTKINKLSNRFFNKTGFICVGGQNLMIQRDKSIH